MKQIIEALDLWIKITGVNPEIRDYNKDDWDVYKNNQSLSESLKIDPTCLTTIMMLDHYVRIYLKERTFTVQSILDDFAGMTEYLQQCRQIYSILEMEEIRLLKKDFINSMLEAMQHYEINEPGIFQAIQDPGNIAFLRRDALRSMVNLSVYQFLQGEPDDDTPSYYKTIHEYWNINSLIEEATKMRNGISLNFIRDPKADDSFFAFAIRNGQTISILTDKEKVINPLERHKSRARSKARSVFKRIDENHFPYSLLNVTYIDDEAYIPPHKEQGLVVHKKQSVPRMQLNELSESEIIWLVMMFELIRDKFFAKGFKTKELSYTGEMLHVNDALIKGVEHLVVRNYLPLVASKVSVKDASFEGIAPFLKNKSNGDNLWIEQRYCSMVSERYLNLVSAHDSSNKFLVSLDHISKYKKESIMRLDVSPSDLTGVHFLSFMDSSRLNKEDSDLQEHAVQLQSVKATQIGSAEQLLYDQRYIARYNYVMMLQLAMKREYYLSKDKIFTWFLNSVQNNKDAIISTSVGDDSTNIRFKTLNLKEPHFRDLRHSQIKLYTEVKGEKYTYRCVKSGSEALVAVLFRPTSPSQLAFLCGCEINELPDVLQHWIKPRRSDDPLDWAIVNPWIDDSFEVVVYLSRSAYNKHRKKRGLAANRFWITEEMKTEKPYFIKPTVGTEVRFSCWNGSEAPPGPWLGVITEIIKEGRVYGIYKVRRHFDGEIQQIEGYQKLLRP
ncbi:hypothetical protein [Paenibacillus sp. Leaf72]|uniref:hypothetical protein n=1 Tax=Paenibacillus sp. Leaf72 TaxID=1736234 RepID=UPI000712CDB8|nr:hypothetical protein [Paenibacillus sp. Leaf72]KQN96964.1 hypothetical protein ASF12_23120 [Paenibacillus sp. Leaf72]